MNERDIALAKAKRFEARTMASIPIFNIFKESETRVVLVSDRNPNETYSLGRSSFELLFTICSTPMSLKELGLILGKSDLTVRNQLTGIYQKFGINFGRREPNIEVKMIAFLVREGLLSYSPQMLSPVKQGIMGDSFDTFFE